LREGASQSGEVCGCCGSGVRLGDREDGVDYVDYAAGKVEVLARNCQQSGEEKVGRGGEQERGVHTAVTTMLFCNKPLKISTLEPLGLASRRWPPVTLAYVSFANSVGRN